MKRSNETLIITESRTDLKPEDRGPEALSPEPQAQATRHTSA